MAIDHHLHAVEDDTKDSHCCARKVRNESLLLDGGLLPRLFQVSLTWDLASNQASDNCSCTVANHRALDDNG